MQIICPNCGSKSPIDAGSLITQTRIVCARCATEFAAQLSDEQAAAAPAALADERGLELFSAAEFTHPLKTRPAPVMGVAAAAGVETAAKAPAAKTTHEAIPAVNVVSPAVQIDTPLEIAPAAPRSPVSAPKDLYDVLSLPEEPILAGGGAAAAAVADADHSNVLEDVFSAGNQSCESKPAAVTAPAVAARAAHDYVTSPLPSDYKTAHREERQPGAESTVRSPVEVMEAAAPEAVVPAEGAGKEVAEAAEAVGREREFVHEAIAGAPVPPQVAAAQSFDAYRAGLRLMRVSPMWLLASGLLFISFVVFCNWFFVPSNLAQGDTPRQRRNEATNRAPASAGVTAALPEARDGETGRAALPPEAEVVNASAKVEEPKTSTTVTAAAPNDEQPRAAEGTAALSPAAGRFTVQVGSYNTQAEAEARAAELRSAGQTVRVVGVDLRNRGRWYRVHVGGFGSRGEAESHGRSLRERGLAGSYITTEAQ
jgi:hypothetical protein